MKIKRLNVLKKKLFLGKIGIINFLYIRIDYKDIMKLYGL